MRSAGPGPPNVPISCKRPARAGRTKDALRCDGACQLHWLVGRLFLHHDRWRPVMRKVFLPLDEAKVSKKDHIAVFRLSPSCGHQVLWLFADEFQVISPGPTETILIVPLATGLSACYGKAMAKAFGNWCTGLGPHHGVLARRIVPYTSTLHACQFTLLIPRESDTCAASVGRPGATALHARQFPIAGAALYGTDDHQKCYANGQSAHVRVSFGRNLNSLVLAFHDARLRHT